MDFCSKHRITKATVGGGGGEWWQTTIRGVEPKLGPIRRERWEQIKDWGTNNFIDKVVDGGDEIDIKKA